MEDYLNEAESRLFDLIETKSWEELTAEERLFAETQMSREEYTLQREIMLEAAMFYEFDVEPLPLAASVSSQPKVQRTIPLYQAIIAVAATVLVFIMIWPRETPAEFAAQPTETKIIQTAPIMAKSHVIDTVIRYITLPASTERVIIDTIREFISYTKMQEEPKLLEVASNLPIPELSRESLNTKGSSLKEENTSQLLPRIVNTIY